MICSNYFSEHVLGPSVVTCVSDRRLDFSLNKSTPFLTRPQREYLNKACGFSLPAVVNIRQIHGVRVLCIGCRFLKGQRSKKDYQKADALITNRPAIPLAVRTADCLSIFFYDPENRAIGLCHAGWRSTHKQIAVKTVRAMKKRYGTQPKNLKIGFGPCIRPCCYEVGENMKKMFSRDVQKRRSKFFLNLPRVNRRQLLSCGVRPGNILDHKECTCCNKKYYSFRRQGKKAGRMFSLMMIRP